MESSLKVSATATTPAAWPSIATYIAVLPSFRSRFTSESEAEVSTLWRRMNLTLPTSA